MARTVIGGLLGGLALYLVGFLFWGTPLSRIAISSVDDTRSAALQSVLAQTLTENGTGTYVIPSPASQQGTVLYGKGPVATVHFNTSGFPAMDSSALISGLILALATGLLIALALRTIADRVPDFASRARVAILFALAATLYLDLGEPLLNHHGWGYFVYLFISDFIGLAVAGLVVARWFLPKSTV